MSARRLEQDVVSADDKPALCERARQEAQARPEDLDSLYLALRCADDEDPLAVQQLLEAHSQHPEHPYLANAAGNQLLRQRDYAGAIAAFEVAATLPPLADGANLALGRLARLTGTASTARLRALAAGSTSLTSLLALDTGDVVNDPERAFSLLARGELDRAVALARPDQDLYRALLPLAAASDGASNLLIEEWRAMYDQIHDGPALWVSIALAERKGAQHPALDAIARKRERFAAQLLKFADAAFLKGPPATVEAELWRLPADRQPMACVMALVRVGVPAPAPCRAFAKAALFASERPYFL